MAAGSIVSRAAGCRVEIEAEIDARREARRVAALQIELQSCRDEVVRLSDLLADQALQLQHGHGAAAAAAHARHSEQQELRSGLAAAHALAAEYAAHAARAGEALRRLLVRAGLRQTAWEAAVRAEPCDGGGGGGGGGKGGGRGEGAGGGVNGAERAAVKRERGARVPRMPRAPRDNPRHSFKQSKLI